MNIIYMYTVTYVSHLMGFGRKHLIDSTQVTQSAPVILVIIAYKSADRCNVWGKVPNFDG